MSSPRSKTILICLLLLSISAVATTDGLKGARVSEHVQFTALTAVDAVEKDDEANFPLMDWRRRFVIGDFVETISPVDFKRRSMMASAPAEGGDDLPPLFPLPWNAYVGFICAFLGLMLAAGGGIGGGGILVPLYILVLNFPVKQAIPLASVTVLGGAVANNMLNVCFHTKGQTEARPANLPPSCIDWDLILQMEPMTIAGALIGADLNDFLPDIVIVVLLLLLLGITAYKTLCKAHRLHQKETEALERKATLTPPSSSSPTASVSSLSNMCNTPDTDETDKLVIGGHSSGSSPAKGSQEQKIPEYGAVTYSPLSDVEGNTSGEEEKGHLLNSGDDLLLQQPPVADKESLNKVIFWNALRLTGLFIVLAVMNVFMGGPEGSSVSSGPSSCGPRCFWLLRSSLLIIICLFAVAARAELLHRVNNNGAVCSAIVWDETNTVHYPLLAITAGLVAGMFGIGGGIIKGPLMLALGVDPTTASATSACMILFTSCTASISYTLFGLLVMDYAVLCLFLGFIATVLGQTLMVYFMRRYQRTSYIAYSIGLVVLLSAICMTVESVIAIMVGMENL